MDEINWAQVGVEAIIILVGIFGVYLKQHVEAERRLTKLETWVAQLRGDHAGLDKKVEGISRNLAEISGALKERGNK